MDCLSEVLAQVDVRFPIILLFLHSGLITTLCDQMACIQANIVSICSHTSARRWIRPAGMSICLRQEIIMINPFLSFSFRVDYILKFRFPPYNVGNSSFLYFTH